MPGTPVEELGVKPIDEEAHGISGTGGVVAWGSQKAPDYGVEGVTEVVGGAIKY
jgi:hypothetical protein